MVKIDPATLPRHANIHYFGQRSYAQLPSYLTGWDVCLLPFARNNATRFISPTKTLEYMAAERPIVSTPITDVAEPYGGIVYLGDTPAAFIAACERALKRLGAPQRVAYGPTEIEKVEIYKTDRPNAPVRCTLFTHGRVSPAWSERQLVPYAHR